MRTLSYILTGRPRNRSDCIDYLQEHRPRKISVELMTNETVSEEFISRNLYATYVWVFEELAVIYEEFYGRCFYHEPYERQCVSIDNANCRLARALDELRQRSRAFVEGSKARFTHDLAYRADAVESKDELFR